MSGAPPAPALTPRRDPPDRPATGADASSRNGRFLGLLRKLIDYGKGMALTLQQRTPTTSLFSLKLRFGTIDVAAIIASITRALMLAAALEARLISHPILADVTPRERVPSPRKPQAARPSAEETEARRYFLPTPAQVEAAVRRRPPGAVLADICCDLGIDCSHPLWKELQAAIRENGGDATKPLLSLFRRTTTSAVVAEAGDDLPEWWLEGRPEPASSGADPPEAVVRTTIAA